MDEINENKLIEPLELQENRFMSQDEVMALRKNHGIESHSLSEWAGENALDKTYIEDDAANDEVSEFQFVGDADDFIKASIEANPDDIVGNRELFDYAHPQQNFEFTEGKDGSTMNQDISKAEGLANGLSSDFVDNKQLFDADIKDADLSKRISYPDNYGMVEGTEQVFQSVDDFKAIHDDSAIITRRGDLDGGTFGVGNITYEESSLAQEEGFFDGQTQQFEVVSIPDDCVIKTGEVASWNEAGEDRVGGGEQLAFIKVDADGRETGEVYKATELAYDGHIVSCNDKFNR